MERGKVYWYGRWEICKWQVRRQTHNPKDKGEIAWQGCSWAWTESYMVKMKMGVSDGIAEIGVARGVSMNLKFVDSL